MKGHKVFRLLLKLRIKNKAKKKQFAIEKKNIYPTLEMRKITLVIAMLIGLSLLSYSSDNQNNVSGKVIVNEQS